MEGRKGWEPFGESLGGSTGGSTGVWCRWCVRRGYTTLSFVSTCGLFCGLTLACLRLSCCFCHTVYGPQQQAVARSTRPFVQYGLQYRTLWYSVHKQRKTPPQKQKKYPKKAKKIPPVPPKHFGVMMMRFVLVFVGGERCQWFGTPRSTKCEAQNVRAPPLPAL
jgi:hypothetical protein